MQTRKSPWFDIVDTEEQAKHLTKQINDVYSRHYRKNHPAYYTERFDVTGTKNDFIVWSYR